MGFNSWCSALQTMKESVEGYVKHTSCLDLATIGSSTPFCVIGESEEIVTMEQRLVYIAATLGAIENIEDQLRASRVRLKALRNHSVTLSPIARLPEDILSIIIAIGHQDGEIRRRELNAKKIYQGPIEFLDPEPDPEEPNRTDHFPTTFSHVCRRWREVALDSSNAWTHLTLRPGYSGECVAEWIRRSREANLSLEISMEDRVETTDVQWAFQNLGSTVLRITSLVLDIKKRDHFLKGLEHFSAYGQPPPLKSLRVNARDRFTVEEEFGSSPGEALTDTLGALQQLHLSGVMIPLGNPAYCRLRELYLEDIVPTGRSPRASEVLAVFQECPELERLGLVMILWSLQGDEDASQLLQPCVVELQNLRALTIQSVPLRLAHFVISSLSAPALEEFTLSSFAMGTPPGQLQNSNVPAVLLTFFQYLRPGSLKSLILSEGRFTKSLCLDRLLTYTPELKSLGGGGPGVINDAVLRAMFNLVPKLERLFLTNCDFFAPYLVDLVEKRDRPGSERPIGSLVVQQCTLRRMHPGLLNSLRMGVDRLVWVGNSEVVWRNIMH